MTQFTAIKIVKKSKSYGMLHKNLRSFDTCKNVFVKNNIKRNGVKQKLTTHFTILMLKKNKQKQAKIITKNQKIVLEYNGFFLFNGELQKFDKFGCMIGFALYNKLEFAPWSKEYTFGFIKDNQTYIVKSVKPKQILEALGVKWDKMKDIQQLKNIAIYPNQLYIKLASQQAFNRRRINLP